MADDIVLYSAGAIPGVPGDQTPGAYNIDTNARTATFVVPLPDMPGPIPDPTQTDAPVVSTDTSAPAPSDTTTPPPATSSSSN